MAEGKKSFILYCDQKGIWDKLDNEQAGKLIKHILSYVNDENPEIPDFITELAFEPIKAQLKRDLKKWENTTDARSNAGKAGAKARWQGMANDGKRIRMIAKMADNVNDNVNDNESDINKPLTLGLPNDNYFLIIPKQIGMTKYRVNGTDGLKALFETVGSTMPLYSDEMAYKFVRNNKGKVFNEFSHVYNSWNLFLTKTA